MKEQARSRERSLEKIPEVGKAVLQEKKCLACHKFREEDGQIAPDLTYMAFMRGEDYIRTFLYTPGKEIPGAIMPWIRMTSEEEKRVIRSLQERGRESHLHGIGAKHLT